nr:hypothetical protein [uncultured bacterium]
MPEAQNLTDYYRLASQVFIRIGLHLRLFFRALGMNILPTIIEVTLPRSGYSKTPSGNGMASALSIRVA